MLEGDESLDTLRVPFVGSLARALLAAGWAVPSVSSTLTPLRRAGAASWLRVVGLSGRLGLGRGVASGGLRAGAAAVGDSDAAVTGRVVAFTCHDLVVVVGPELQAGIGPGTEMGAYIDGSAGAFALTDGPELLEGLGTINGGLVDTGALGDVIDGPVKSHLTFPLSIAGWIIRSKILNNVVLDKRAPRPTVDSEVGVSVVLVASTVRHHSISSSRVPSLSAHQVATRSPLNSIVATSAIRVCRLRTVVGPPRVEETVMGSLRARCTATRGYVGRGERERADRGSDSNEEGFEGDHDTTK